MDASSVLVKPSVAREQLDRDKAERVGGGSTPGPDGGDGPGGGGPTGGGPDGQGEGQEPGEEFPTRFYGSVVLDAARVGRDAGRVADEILSHLLSMPNARLKISLEVEAELPGGASKDVQRNVSENARSLRFESYGFEQD